MVNESAEKPATSTTPELQANDAQTGEASEPIAYDIVVLCHPRNVSNLVQTFEYEIKDAAGALPLSVLWSGLSGGLHQGVIVLEWQGKLTPRFLQNLSIDQEIFDYIIYDYRWQAYDDTQGSGSEPEELTNQIDESHQVEGEQLV